jgi:upstream activation factor subunit UAF30
VKAIEAVFAAIAAGKMKAIHVDVARHLGKLAALNVYGELEDHVAKLLDVGKIGKNAGIESFLEKCPDNMVAPALLLLIMADEFEDTPDQVNAKRPMLDLFAKQTGVDLKAIENELKAGLRKADAAKKAATKKVPPKATSAKARRSVAKKRTPNMAFMSRCTAPRRCRPSSAEPIPRVEIVSKLWAYIKKHKLQDNVNKRMVNCDEKMKAIFGKAKVSMFEMAGLIGKHTSSKPFAGAATKAPAPIATKPAKGRRPPRPRPRPASLRR